MIAVEKYRHSSQTSEITIFLGVSCYFSIKKAEKICMRLQFNSLQTGALGDGAQDCQPWVSLGTDGPWLRGCEYGPNSLSWACS